MEGSMDLDQFIKETKKLKIKDYNPVLKMMRTSWGKKGKASEYHTIRKSWPYIVVLSIHDKIGTPKDNKKRSLTNIIRNWIKERHGRQYKIVWLMFHPKFEKDKKSKKSKWIMKWDDKDFDKISESRHIKNAADIWFSKKGKALRRELETHGKYKKFPIPLIDIQIPPPKDSKDS